MPNPEISDSQQPLLTSSSGTKPQVHLFKNQIILNPTISKFNLSAYLLFCTYAGAIVIPTNLLLLPLLTVVYGLSEEQRINVTTIVQIGQLATKLLAASWFGYICDKYGRRSFMLVGVLLTGGTIAILPNLPDVYPCYIIVQIFYELGTLCMMTPPLLADYIDYETKGRVAGLVSIVNYASASLTTYLVSKINLQDNIPLRLHEIAILGLVLGILITLGLKGGAYHKALFYDKKAEEAKRNISEMAEQEEEQSNEISAENLTNQPILPKVKVYPERDTSQDEEPNRGLVDINGLNLNDSVTSRRNNQVIESRLTNNDRSHKPGLMAGLREAKRNPWILTGYISSFLFMANVMLVNTVLVNYCTEVVGSQDGANQAYALTNKHMIVGCISAFFFGFFIDKYNKFKILMFVLVDSIFAVLFLILSPSPYNVMAYISMVLFGISCSGLNTMSNQLVSKYPNPKYRASVMAVSSMCSTVGSAMSGILGVFLSQYNVSIPYYLYLGASGIAFCLLIAIYASKKNILNNL